MKLRIVIIILVITNIAAFLYAYAQKVAADQQRELAISVAEKAQHNAMEAHRMAETANEQINKLKEEAASCK